MKIMNRLYNNLDEAVAFSLRFNNMCFIYDDVIQGDFCTVVCEACDYEIQTKDYLFPRASFKKPTGILSTLEYGISQELRDDLINHFDISEKDFRPIRNKRGEIVYYQITPQHVMQPIHKENEWKPKEPCSQCGSVQYMHHDYENEKGEFYHYISQAALDDLHDLNVTFEKFRFHYPLYVISRRVYDYLSDRFPRTLYRPFFLK